MFPFEFCPKGWIENLFLKKGTETNHLLFDIVPV